MICQRMLGAMNDLASGRISDVLGVSVVCLVDNAGLLHPFLASHRVIVALTYLGDELAFGTGWMLENFDFLFDVFSEVVALLDEYANGHLLSATSWTRKRFGLG